jgi:acetyl-CoA carboxylase biotin carboxyl carrier protein
MANVDSDVKKIEKIIALMKENDLVEVEISHGDDKICLKRQQVQVPTFTGVPMLSPNAMAAAGPGLPPPSQDESLPVIPSPLVGTFYTAASPDTKPYVTIGTHVDPSTVVCIIEAMKVMNEIKAETSGTIVAMLVENGAAVEYGQPLYRVRPN